MVSSISALSATEIAGQIRANWAQAKNNYLAAIKPYESQPAYAGLLTQYTAALNNTGTTLEQYLTLKLAKPAPPATAVTPVIDQLIKDLAALRTLNGQATGPLVNVLGAALAQHSQTAQTALKNMR